MILQATSEPCVRHTTGDGDILITFLSGKEHINMYVSPYFLINLKDTIDDYLLEMGPPRFQETKTHIDPMIPYRG
jgi:hypothetical protein